MDDLISRQTAIDALKHLSKNYAGIGRREYHPHIDFVIEVITMLPSVTPKHCEDAISRKQALDAFGLSEKTRKYGGDHSGYDPMMLYEIQNVIEGLPSVSTEKTGLWIDRFPLKECECSECNYLIMLSFGSFSEVVKQMKYCPNCGARMREVKE